MTVFVQFSEASKEQVVAEFGGPQAVEFYPYQGELAEDDPRYVAFIELIASITGSKPEAAARAWRDAEIVRVAWLRDRHRDELEIDEATTITAVQYTELLSYIRDLRDWPVTADFPAEESRPLVPEWIASQTQ